MNLKRAAFLTFSLIFLSSVLLYELKSSDALVNFLYNTRFGALLRSTVTSNPYASSLVGWLTNRSLSRYAIGRFATAYNIDLSQAEREQICQYSSFNDFFTRTLKSNVRPIDQDLTAIISPADGQILVIKNLSEESELLVKNKAFSISTLLNDKKLAATFYGGVAYIIYLAPRDYHRFHFPINCIPAAPKVISGKYESVNLRVYQFGIQPLTENERHLIMLENKNIGNVAFVAVGALCVGKITETYIPNEPAQKGQEAGYFSFGGSTIVLLFPPAKITVNPELTIKSEFVTIQMGQKIGSFKTSLEDLD